MKDDLESNDGKDYKYFAARYVKTLLDFNQEDNKMFNHEDMTMDPKINVKVALVDISKDFHVANGRIILTV
jgi:hypothetical protein